MQNQPSMNRPSFDLSDAEDMKCGECGSVYFKQLVRVKRVSPLLSPSGQEMFVPVQVLACQKCDNIVQDIEEDS